MALGCPLPQSGSAYCSLALRLDPMAVSARTAPVAEVVCAAL
jgi:hypothetical protein